MDIAKLKQEAEEARQKVIANSAKYGLQYPEEFISLLFDAHAKQIALQAEEKEAETKKYDPVELSRSMFASKEDYMEAIEKLTPIADDGWIKWEGGECPVNPKDKVVIKWRDGKVASIPYFAQSYLWQHDNDAHDDIIAYRIIRPAADRAGEP